MLRRVLPFLALLLLLLVSATPPVRAQLQLELSPPSASVTPGNQVSLLASLTNTGTESISLIGIASSIAPLGNVTLDDTAFQNNLPLTLSSGQNFSELINFVAQPSAQLGDYILTYAVEGEGITTSSSYTGRDTATVTVTTIAVPEPTPFLLLATGLLAMAVGMVKRRQSVTSGHCRECRKE